MIRLQQLFQQYQQAFIEYDLNKVCRCYHLPCTLNTPDKLVLLNSDSDCIQEFGAIFAQLKEAKTSAIIAKRASYMKVSKQLYLVCIDWDFIDGQGEIFADFAAVYHVVDNDDSLKIVNVVSHELECSLTLPNVITW